MIGHPVAHSLSPTIHRAAFAATGLDWRFEAIDVAPGHAVEAVAELRPRIAGLSVTMPHKTDVIGAVDELTPVAAALGAVNCLWWRDGDGNRVLVGDNTDGGGLVLSLRRERSFDVRDRRCVVIGAGGAARSVVAALAGAGAADIAVVNRSADRAASAAALGDGRARVGTVDDAGEADLVVNATSLGMDTGTTASGSAPVEASVLPTPPEAVARAALVVDLVYHPLETPWLAALRRRGVDACNGVGMLVGQAALAFERWTGLDAPYEAMRAAVEDALS